MAYNQIFTSVGGKLVYLPETTTTKKPKEAKSLDVVFVNETTGMVELGLGAHPTSSRAEKVLLDKVTLNLLTTIGSSDFDPSLGSFLTVVQRSNSKDLTTIQAKVVLALNTIKDKIKTEQESTTSLSPDQRLLDLRLSAIYTDPTDPTNLLVEVLVVTEANQEYILTT